VKWPSRREFLKQSSLAVAAGTLAARLDIARAAHPDGDDCIRLGLVGCGGRGTGAAAQAMNTHGPTRLVAVADVFTDNVRTAVEMLASNYPDKMDVPLERQFVGFDAYQKVLDCDIDLVILATPPGFRPQHFEAAVNAKKHVFMEKPVAVDSPGVRRVLAATRQARENNLAVAVGLQRRHEPRYQETIKRLRDGAIGDLILARAYWNSAGVWTRPRTPNQTEMEYQMRNWYYFNWLCGDHIVEQHIHNLDVINWVKDAYPVSANGQGGRQVRTGMDHGQIFDHHFVEFTYEDGTKLFSQCRHIPDCWNEVSEHVHGTEGRGDISGAAIFNSSGSRTWAFGEGGGEGHQQEHHDLFSALRRGEIPNEGEFGAMSTMTAILGRMATYSGNEITMKDAIESVLVESSTDEYHSMSDTPPVLPDEQGNYPIPMPGSCRVLEPPA
jgi:predicted dehydrogenase